MKLLLWSLGKPHDPYVKSGVEEFTSRLSNYFKTHWNIIPVPKNLSSLPPAEQKKRESALVLDQMSKDDFLVLLDEGGKQLSSEGLAKFLQDRANAGSKQVIFLIGGAFGVDEHVKRRADFTWSLSHLVFPHQLARLIVAEQLYRACTILRNEKYHHK